MRLLSIGTDRKLFEKGSAVARRQEAYAEKLGHTDIVVFTKQSQAKSKTTFGNVSVIPTNSWAALFYGFDAWRLARRLEKPDVVTAQDPFETGLIGFFIARSFSVPLHAQVHTDFMAKEFTRRSFINFLRRRIAWFVLRRASRIRVILQSTADSLRERGISAPIEVLPIFVDTARFAKIARTKHPRWKIALLCVGRLEKEKRFELAIDALGAVRAKGHDAGLTIVGDGAEREALETRAQALGLSNRVEFVGWQNDLTKYYSEADLLFVPSRYEGYGLVIVEALAAGIPVLSTDVGVAREAGAIVVPASEFSSALVRWIENGPRTASLALHSYPDREDYLQRYCDDIRATATTAIL